MYRKDEAVKSMNIRWSLGKWESFGLGHSSESSGTLALVYILSLMIPVVPFVHGIADVVQKHVNFQCYKLITHCLLKRFFNLQVEILFFVQIILKCFI